MLVASRGAPTGDTTSLEFLKPQALSLQIST